MIQKIKLQKLLPTSHGKELEKEITVFGDVKLSGIKTRYLAEYVNKNIEYLVIIWKCDFSNEYTHAVIDEKAYKIDSIAPCESPQKLKLILTG